MTDLFSLREGEIFRTLKELNDCEFVVIGGYSVNAYTLPRFSVDCDIAVKDEDELSKIAKNLLKLGYVKEQSFNVPYSGTFARFEKKIENNFSVSMDILVGEVTDRMTSASFSADWVFKHSALRILKGKTIREELKLRTINCDALLVMKIVSCRSTDIRDVFMMIPNVEDKEWMKREVASRYNFKDRLDKIIEKVNSKQFKDGLSGVYGQFDRNVFDKHKKLITKLLD